MYHELLLQAQTTLVQPTLNLAVAGAEFFKVWWELLVYPAIGLLAAIFRRKIKQFTLFLYGEIPIIKKTKMNTQQLVAVQNKLDATQLTIDENSKITKAIYQQLTAVNGGSMSERVNTLVASVAEIKNQQDNMSERVARLIAYSKTNEAILPFGSFYMMPDGKWVECNKKLGEWTGRERADFFDKEWINAIYIEDREWFFKLIIEVMANQYELDRPVRMQDKDGKPFTVRFQAKAVVNGSKLLGYRGTIEKVSVNLPTEK